jgi:hypothetical protein
VQEHSNFLLRNHAAHFELRWADVSSTVACISCSSGPSAAESSLFAHVFV